MRREGRRVPPLAVLLAKVDLLCSASGRTILNREAKSSYAAYVVDLHRRPPRFKQSGLRPTETA